MARVTLIEAQPWSENGNPVDYYLAGGGSRGYDHRGRTSWKGGVVKEPRFSASIDFDENGWTGGALAQSARISYFPADKDTLSSIASRQWIGSPIVVLAGDDATAAPVWTTLLTGTVTALSINEGRVEFTVADLGAKLGDPFIKATARFAGTGGIEGDADVEGRIKRRSYGKVFNVEGRVLVKASNVYEFGDPAFPFYSFEAVKDMGRTGPLTLLAWQGSIAATLAALIASAPPAGGATIAPSIACVKWWTQPSGPLTADIRGDDTLGGYTNTVAGIANRLLVQTAGAPAADGAALAAASAARPAEVGLHIDDAGESTANALDRLLMGASMIWVLDPSGVVFIREITFAAPVETVTVQAVERVEAYKPITSRRFAYRRAHRKHSDGEISAAVLVGDIDGLGLLAVEDNVTIDGNGSVMRADGVTPVNEAQVVTNLGTAAYFTGQVPIATDADAINRILAMRGDNMVRNSLFEEGSAFWSAVGLGGRYDSFGPGHVTATGIYLPAPVAGTASPYAYANDAVRVPVAGRVVYMSALFFNDGPSASDCVFGMVGEDAAGALLYPSPATFSVPPGGGVFVPRTRGIVLPIDCKKVSFYIQRPNAAAGSGTVYFTSFRVAFAQQGATLGATASTDTFRADGSTVMTEAELRTALGTAAYFNGQAPIATAANAHLQISRLDVDGRQLDSRLYRANMAFALIPSLRDPPTLSDTPVSGTVTINVGSMTLYPDWGGTVTYPSGSIAGLAFETLYYIYRIVSTGDPTSTGSGWGAATTINDATGLGKVFTGSVFLTRPDAATPPPPPPPPPPGGGGWCVAIEALVELADGSHKRAAEVVVGDRLVVLNYATLAGLTEAVVDQVEFSSVERVRLVMASGGTLSLSRSTPLTIRDGSTILAPDAQGFEVPVIDHRDGSGFRWERVAQVIPIDLDAVAHIHCGGATYAAGDKADFMILTHNPDKP
jgi:hypothetical protein